MWDKIFFANHPSEQDKMNRIYANWSSRTVIPDKSNSRTKQKNRLFSGQGPSATPVSSSTASKADLQFLAIRIINIMTKTEETWLPQHPSVVTNLLKIWVSEPFQDRHRKVVRY